MATVEVEAKHELEGNIDKVEITIDKLPTLDEQAQRFEESFEALIDARDKANRDRDYYDGNQWTDEEIYELNNRSQPIITANHIAPKINYILGTEVRQRVDPYALPRTPVHEDGSFAMTDGLRYVADRENFDLIRSEVFENMLIEGYGGCQLAPEIVENKNTGKKSIEIKLHYIPWDRLAYDHTSKRRDFSDARWVAVVVWMDLKEALADPVYGKKPKVLQDAVENGYNHDDTYEDNPSLWATKNPERIRIVQMYFKNRGQWYESHFTKHANEFLVEPRKVRTVDAQGNTWCPLILGSSFVMRRSYERAPERYGVVRIMVPPQDEINKRRSKMLHLLNVAQLWVENGAIEMEPEEARQEVAKPDGYIPVTPGSLRDGRIELKTNLDMAQGQFNLLQEAKSEIDSIGPQAPLIGSDQRIQSARSMIKRQQAGEMQLEPVFDAMRDWQRRVYRGIAFMICQFWPEERWIRVRDDKERKGFRFVPINRPITRSARLRELLDKRVPLAQAVNMVDIQPIIAEELLAQAGQMAQQRITQAVSQAQQNGQQIPEQMLQAVLQKETLNALLMTPLMQEQITHNSIGELDTDIVLDTAPDTTIIAQEEFEKLVELAGTGMVQIPPTVLIEASQLRNKRTLREMLEEPPPDPMQEQMAQLQLALMQANVEKTKAQAADEMASAQERQANARFKLESQAAKTQAQAMEAAAKAGSQMMPKQG